MREVTYFRRTALRAAVYLLSTDALMTFQTLTMQCDDMGIYPLGINFLSIDIGRKDIMVRPAIEELIAGDWIIRIPQKTSNLLTGKADDEAYQVSPYYLGIPSHLRVKAETHWYANGGKRGDWSTLSFDELQAKYPVKRRSRKVQQ